MQQAVAEEISLSKMRNMSNSYDAIIIGGGHNGLVAAAYLAKAGKKVLVLERRDKVGGAAVTEEFRDAPGFKFSALAEDGRLLPRVVKELGIHNSGFIIDNAPEIFAPQLGGGALTLWKDSKRSAEEIGRFSGKDAGCYAPFIAQVEKMGAVLRTLMMTIPPNLPNPTRADLFELAKLANPTRKLGKDNTHDLIRVLPMSAADWIDEWFESDALRGIVAGRAVTGITWGPRASGTAHTLLYACASGGLLGTGAPVKGGMGALTQQLAEVAKKFGAEIRTKAEVAKIVVKEQTAVGVALEDGSEIRADVVVSNADPRTTFLKLLDPQVLDAYFLAEVQTIKYRGSCARVHLALDALPEFRAANGNVDLLRGHISIAPSLDYVERAYDDAKYGDLSRAPYLDATIPTLNDASLAPQGKHVMSVYAQYAPYQLKKGNWNEQRERLGNVVVDTLSQYAPNLRNLIRAKHVITPLDMETVYGLAEGNPNHGEMTLDQFLHMRPVAGYAQYRAPIKGLYLCGAGTHPGGGVTGANGLNAARVMNN
jgi:phytoene dehydrogenase-like protein